MWWASELLKYALFFGIMALLFLNLPYTLSLTYLSTLGCLFYGIWRLIERFKREFQIKGIRKRGLLFSMGLRWILVACSVIAAPIAFVIWLLWRWIYSLVNLL